MKRLSKYYAPPVTGFYMVYGKKIFLEKGSHVQINASGEVEYHPPAREAGRDGQEAEGLGADTRELKSPDQGSV